VAAVPSGLSLTPLRIIIKKNVNEWLERGHYRADYTFAHLLQVGHTKWPILKIYEKFLKKCKACYFLSNSLFAYSGKNK
jgi:hypothetical protein